jgi:hypothetical protein
MRNAQRLEAIFVAGCIFAGMTGQFWAKAPQLFQRSELIRYELISNSAHRIMDPRKLCEIFRSLGAVSRVLVQR